jgi:hypothetical protein
MKTIEIKLYQFSELSEEAKEKAVENLSDINVDYEWWLSTYEDAETVKLKLTEFDLERNRHCKGEFMESPAETAELILTNHGKDCETYKTAKTFLAELNELTGKYPNIEDCPEDSIEDLEDYFLKSLLEDYRIILSNEYDYLTSKAAIIETIEANEYDFTEDGKIY